VEKLTSFPKVITRVAPPTHLDEAPFGTKCLIEASNDEYKQMSDDEDKPRWEKI
jgi:hypothetical protein